MVTFFSFRSPTHRFAKVWLGLALVVTVGGVTPSGLRDGPRPFEGPLTLVLSGQSNAGGVQPFLRGLATVVGHAASSTPIACWEPGGDCWQRLERDIRSGRLTFDTVPPLLTARGYDPRSINAFVWWQGEADPDTPDYYGRLGDVICRLRTLAGNRSLLVVVMQLGRDYSTGRPYPSGARSAADSERWVGHDQHALFIETQDLPFQADRTHLTAHGYARAAKRIEERIRARLGQPRP